jgi:alpha-beta hydrolase superfamily lysophospholipase
MTECVEWTYEGYDGRQRVARTWLDGTPRYIALLCHGYGEHVGRYQYVADRLVEHGAIVHGVDHVGHGASAGERALIPDFAPVVEDFHVLHLAARAQHRGLPVVLVGHSMGGLIAARYAQVYGGALTILVLSAPILGSWVVLSRLLAADEIPDTPINPAMLSRDPAVGAAYAADPLVWHGPFKRPTLEAMSDALEVVNGSGTIGRLPTLWLHGEADLQVPIEATRKGIGVLRGPSFQERTYPGARHEVFNETNKAEVLSDVTRFVDEQISPG